jgi:hypothetical protein
MKIKSRKTNLTAKVLFSFIVFELTVAINTTSATPTNTFITITAGNNNNNNNNQNKTNNNNNNHKVGYAVAQLVKALCHKPKGRGFDSRWCHWNFSLK